MSRIEVKGISKSFGDTVALDNVSVNFESGKIYGLLGRNGAGKSTLLNIISNRLFADAGTVFVDGEPAIENDRAESKLYLMSEKNYYPEEMKVKEVLKWTKEFYGDYFDMESAKSMAEIFKLDLNKKTSKLSTGYKSIYKVVTALNLNTPYLFLDEPVLGLDANHRDLFYDLLLKSYAENPRTIVISTHLIEEVSKIIEKVIIIKSGMIIEDTTTEQLLSSGYSVSGPAAYVDEYISGKNVIGIDNFAGLKIAYILGTADKSAASEKIEFMQMDLQKLFVKLTNS